MRADLCCTEAGSDGSWVDRSDSAVAGSPETHLWFAWGVIPHLLHPELPSHSLAFPSVPRHACRGGQTLLGHPPPAPSPPSGGFLGSSGKGMLGNLCLLLQVSPPKQQQISLNSYLPLTKQDTSQLSTKCPMEMERGET